MIPSMRLYFARHGESEANRARVIANRGWSHGLTDEGRRQALELAVSIQVDLATHGHGDQRPVRVVTSPLRRASETADVLGEILGAGVERASALREADCGVAEGRSDETAWRAHDEIEARWTAGDRTARIDGGESLDDLVDRFGRWVDGLVGMADRSVIVAVGHGSLYGFVLPWFVVDPDRGATGPVTIGLADALIVERDSDGSLVRVAMLSDALPAAGR